MMTGLDLTITKIEHREQFGGTWVGGTIDDEVRFDALVFADHAESEEHELGRSRISKLWIQRILDRKTLFNFDRGLDVPAQDNATESIVAFLCEGLADFVNV